LEIGDGSRLGEVIENIRTFVLPGGSETYTFKMDFEYDSWNRIKQMTYPDGEVVSYQYDLGGQLFAMAGNKDGTPYPIIDSIFYDKFASRALIAYGNGTNTQYDYEPYRRRLAGLQTFSGSSALMDLTYSYDEENNITGISNSAFAVNGLGGNYSYSYEYDSMYRLVDAGGSFTDLEGSIFSYNLAMSYSPSGNILSKSMDALTFQSTMGGVVAVNYNNNYQYHSAKPHAISSITGSGTDHQMEWDANGNLTHHMRNGDGIDIDRQLCWDEENRLTAVRDQNQLSAYIYDAGGERVWKLTGQVQQMQIGGGGVVDVVDLNNKTLYASPYLVYNEQGYSKHYYAGAERVSSRIGGGMANAPLDPLSSALDHLSDHDDYDGITSGLREMMLRNTGCAGFNSSYLSMEQNYLHSIEHSTHHSDPEPNWYIYHSDHLGSSAFLTDASGDPTQHLQYMPFGETFVEQRSVTSYYTPYTFSAKERDLETGYSYFGARYYDADISVWLSVDPMADKYPSMSAYMYCAGNPVMLVDPDGRSFDNFQIFSDGSIFVERTDDPTNTYTYVNSDGSSVNLGTYTVVKNSSGEDMVKIGEGASGSNSMFEWSNINSGNLYFEEDAFAGLLGGIQDFYSKTSSIPFLGTQKVRITQLMSLERVHSYTENRNSCVDIAYFSTNGKSGALTTSSNISKGFNENLLSSLKKFGIGNSKVFTSQSENSSSAYFSGTTGSRGHPHHFHFEEFNSSNLRGNLLPTHLVSARPIPDIMRIILNFTSK
jgi:RHS repeat-associated protein